jgi:hypothetical protein
MAPDIREEERNAISQSINSRTEQCVMEQALPIRSIISEATFSSLGCVYLTWELVLIESDVDIRWNVSERNPLLVHNSSSSSSCLKSNECLPFSLTSFILKKAQKESTTSTDDYLWNETSAIVVCSSLVDHHVYSSFVLIDDTLDTSSQQFMCQLQ